MGLYEKLIHPFTSYESSVCETCENFIEDNDDFKCKAFPDGIPDEINIFSEERKSKPCSKEYSYREK